MAPFPFLNNLAFKGNSTAITTKPVETGFPAVKVQQGETQYTGGTGANYEQFDTKARDLTSVDGDKYYNKADYYNGQGHVTFRDLATA